MSGEFKELLELWRTRLPLIAAAVMLVAPADALASDRPLLASTAGALFIAMGLALLPRFGHLFLGAATALAGVVLTHQFVTILLTDTLWLSLTLTVVVVGGALVGLYAPRSPFTHRFHLRTSLPGEVARTWAVLFPRLSADPWDKSLLRIDPVLGSPNRLRLVLGGVWEGKERFVELSNVREGASFELRRLQSAHQPAIDIDNGANKIALEARTGDETLVSIETVLIKPRLITVLAAVLHHPARGWILQARQYLLDTAETDTPQAANPSAA